MPTSTIRTPSIMSLARRKLSEMTTSERAVAEALLQRPEEFIRWSIDDAVKATGVSTATIARLSRTLQCSGFKELKLLLAAELGAGVMASLDIHHDDGPDVIAEKVLRTDLQAVQDTLELLDHAAFVKAVEHLAQTQRIEVYGIGSSAPVAHDAYYRLLKLGLPVAVLTDPHIQVVSASQLGPRDTALIISHTGRTKEILEAARLARAGGSTLIGLTSYSNSPLSELTDILLVASTSEARLRLEAMASRIAHLSLIDALSVALAMYLKRHKRLEQSQAIVESKRLPKNTS